MKINGNKVSCGIDLISIKYHDLSLIWEEKFMIVTNCLKTSRIIRRINKKPVINFNHIINYSPRVPSTTILVTGVIKLNSTQLEGRLDSTHKRPSCLLTGTHPSQRSVSA